jgi:CRP-like cAMP-binding protein
MPSNSGVLPYVPCSDCRLRKFGAFKPVAAPELDFINRMKRAHIAVAAGKELIRQGETEPRLMTLYAGWAFRTKTLSDGRRQILNFLLPGDLIGMQEIGAEASPHGVETLTDVEICVLDRGKLWDLFTNHPSLAFDATWLTAQEERLVDEQLLTVGRRFAGERVAALLIDLYRRAENLELLKDGVLEVPLTQQHIADALGMSLIHTHRTLRHLEKLGLFRFERRRIHLLNPRAIEIMAEYYGRPKGLRPLI